MLIRHAIFCEPFPWFIFLAECEIFNFVDASRCTHTASHCVSVWMTTCPLSVKRLEIAGHVNYFYLKVSFHQYSIGCSLSRNMWHKLAAT